MTSNQLPKSGLIKQDFKDKRWEQPLNQGFDTWEGRIGVGGNVDPPGVARGYYSGQTFYNTATGVLWFCATPGATPAATVWKQVASQDAFLNYGNYVQLLDGAMIAPVYHQKVLGWQNNVPGNWTMQAGGFHAGWVCRMMVWDVLGGGVTIIGAQGQPLISQGTRLTSLSLGFADKGDLYSPDGVSFVWIGTRHYTSTAFPLNAGATYDFSHSLGVQPQRITLRLNCIVPELGFVPGDSILVNTDTQAATTERSSNPRRPRLAPRSRSPGFSCCSGTPASRRRPPWRTGPVSCAPRS
jgi:hypothetical protein